MVMQEQDLEDFFNGYRGCTAARMRKDRNGNTVGFVEFESIEDASDCKDQAEGEKSWRIRFSNSKPMGGADGGKRRRPESGPRPPVRPPALPPMMNPMMGNAGGMGMMSGFGAALGGGGLGGFGMLGSAAAGPEELYIEGIPQDASHREVGHLFRLFPGFIKYRLIQSGSRRSDDPREVRWLCFVEMATRTHADVVIGALSGYAMDEERPHEILRLQYAKNQRNGQGPRGPERAGRGRDDDRRTDRRDRDRREGRDRDHGRDRERDRSRDRDGRGDERRHDGRSRGDDDDRYNPRGDGD